MESVQALEILPYYNFHTEIYVSRYEQEPGAWRVMVDDRNVESRDHKEIRSSGSDGRIPNDHPDCQLDWNEYKKL